jgi:hypothetical protein
MLNDLEFDSLKKNEKEDALKILTDSFSGNFINI